MIDGTKNRIDDLELARAMTKVEDYDRTRAVELRAHKASLHGLKNIAERRRGARLAKKYDQSATRRGEWEKYKYENDKEILNIDREKVLTKIKDQLEEMVPSFDAPEGSWNLFVEWSTDKESGKRTLKFNTKQTFDKFSTVNRNLVITDGEEPKILRSFTDGGGVGFNNTEITNTEPKLLTDRYEVNIAFYSAEHAINAFHERWLEEHAGNSDLAVSKKTV